LFLSFQNTQCGVDPRTAVAQIRRMQIAIANVLDHNDLSAVHDALDAARFVDGKATAGFAARLVKDNEQAGASATLDIIRKRVSDRILANDVFRMAVRPKALTQLLFSRYAPGMTYGSHVDDALIQGLRTDVSFTLFLDAPETYDGGELVIESAAGEDPVKLPAGALIAYPATSLHRVAEVTRGVRRVAVGWARSFIRDAGQRELLFDLDTARRRIFERDGKSAEFDLMSKSLANLMRMWAED
jgi:PKHD-type hydroxylase